MSLAARVLMGFLGASALVAPVPLALSTRTELAKPYVTTRRVRTGNRYNNRFLVQAAQLALNDRGAHLDVNGILDQETRTALRDFQHHEKLTPTGRLNQATLHALGLVGYNSKPPSAPLTAATTQQPKKASGRSKPKQMPGPYPHFSPIPASPRCQGPFSRDHVRAKAAILR